MGNSKQQNKRPVIASIYFTGYFTPIKAPFTLIQYTTPTMWVQRSVPAAFVRLAALRHRPPLCSAAPVQFLHAGVLVHFLKAHQNRRTQQKSMVKCSQLAQKPRVHCDAGEGHRISVKGA